MGTFHTSRASGWGSERCSDLPQGTAERCSAARPCFFFWLGVELLCRRQVKDLRATSTWSTCSAKRPPGLFCRVCWGDDGKPVKDGGGTRRHVNTGESRSWKDNPESKWTGSVVNKASMRAAGQPGHEHGSNGATLQLARRSAESIPRLVDKQHGSSDKTMRRYTRSPI